MNGEINAHGADIYDASAKYGFKSDEFLDYSSNINPLGIPPELKKIFIAGVDSLVRYPDIRCTSLIDSISEYTGVGREMLVAGNGASEIIFLLMEAIKPKRLLIPVPTFSEYANAAFRHGCRVEYFEIREEDEFRLDIDGLKSRLEKNVDAVFLCNPNNPTSTLLKRDELLDIVAHARKTGVRVFLDEAFIELTETPEENTLCGFAERFENLFIIRAFTKVFAVPGIRIGYGIGNSTVIGKMRCLNMPWSVNSLACLVGEFLPVSGRYLSSTSKWLNEEIDRFYGALKRFDNIKPFKPSTNFVLVKILDPSLNAGILRDRMASKGVLIRNASNFTNLSDKFVRFAIKDRDNNDRFLRVLEESL